MCVCLYPREDDVVLCNNEPTVSFFPVDKNELSLLPRQLAVMVTKCMYTLVHAHTEARTHDITVSSSVCCFMTGMCLCVCLCLCVWGSLKLLTKRGHLNNCTL